MDEAGGTLYTIGYEGHSGASLVRTLQAAKVRRLIDVRLTPNSRRRDFSLNALFQRLHRAGIAYEHHRELGNPPDIRKLWEGTTLDEGRLRYRQLVKEAPGDPVDRLIRLARIEPVAILCREREPHRCHRSVVAEVAVERDEGLGIIHL